MSSVCVLKNWEVKAWREEKELPSCSNHFHIRKVEAFQLSYLGNVSWVGPHHVCVHKTFELKVLNQWRFPRVGLVEK